MQYLTIQFKIDDYFDKQFHEYTTYIKYNRSKVYTSSPKEILAKNFIDCLKDIDDSFRLGRSGGKNVITFSPPNKRNKIVGTYKFFLSEELSQLNKDGLRYKEYEGDSCDAKFADFFDEFVDKYKIFQGVNNNDL